MQPGEDSHNVLALMGDGLLGRVGRWNNETMNRGLKMDEIKRLAYVVSRRLLFADMKYGKRQKRILSGLETPME